jgi:hypothetical protein
MNRSPVRSNQISAGRLLPRSSMHGEWSCTSPKKSKKNDMWHVRIHLSSKGVYESLPDNALQNDYARWYPRTSLSPWTHQLYNLVNSTNLAINCDIMWHQELGVMMAHYAWLLCFFPFIWLSLVAPNSWALHRGPRSLAERTERRRVTGTGATERSDVGQPSWGPGWPRSGMTEHLDDNLGNHYFGNPPTVDSQEPLFRYMIY